MCGFVFTMSKRVSGEQFTKSIKSLRHRGPDDQKIINTGSARLGFARLAIMDLSHSGDQPFFKDNTYYQCNGEIYNFEKLKKELSFDYVSTSDCEVLIPLFKKFGIPQMLQKLDGEFALVIYNEKTQEVVAARDPMGIRPIFYGYDEDGKVSFASEVKSLQDFCFDIKPLPPGTYYKNGKIETYLDLSSVENYHQDSMSTMYKKIHDKLVSGVLKRTRADAQVGYLLSGGLDSSLVCAIAQRHSKEPIKTFAIGMGGDAIDLKYAKEVAVYIGSDHTEVIIHKEDVLGVIEDVVRHLESFDITTVRASIGMYLVCKYIKNKTDIKVLLTGEVSDEIFGYKYTDFAPSPEEFQKEAAKRVKELYQYDVLRADRCIAGHSLEARVPFSDTDFVSYIMSIDPKIKMNSYGQGKYILRKAFEGSYLPDSILYREKAAFSDAVGHSMVDYIKEYADSVYSEEDVSCASEKYKHATPFTRESLLFRDLFEKFYPGKSYLIPGFWMPNSDWENCDVSDPSARVLPNYGDSGV